MPRMKAPGWGSPDDRARRRVLYPFPDDLPALRSYIDHLREVLGHAGPEALGGLKWVGGDLVWLSARLVWALNKTARRAGGGAGRAPGRSKKPADPYDLAMHDHAVVLRCEGESTYRIARRLGVSQSWVYRRVGGVNDPRQPVTVKHRWVVTTANNAECARCGLVCNPEDADVYDAAGCRQA